MGGAELPPQPNQECNFLVGRECTGYLHPFQHRAWDKFDPTGFPVKGVGIEISSAIHDHLWPILNGPIGQILVGQQ